MNDKDDKFITNVRKSLDESVDLLHPDIEQRLGTLKYRALDSATKATGYWGRWLFGAGSLMIVVMVMIGLPIHDSPKKFDLVTIEIIGEPDAFEFFQHDMEFYQWLTEEMQNENDPTNSDLGYGIDSVSAISGHGTGAKGVRGAAEYGAAGISGRVQG